MWPSVNCVYLSSYHWHIICLQRARLPVLWGEGKVRFHPVAGHTGPEGSRGIALLFHNLGTRWGGWSTSRPGRFYARERPGNHCTGGCLSGEVAAYSGRWHFATEIHISSSPPPPREIQTMRVTSDFRRDVEDICTLLGCYAA
jgi:hypothetical protein